MEEVSDDEIISTETFFHVCKLVGLTVSDMQYMTIGNCLDFVSHVLESQEPNKNKQRNASQSDFDNF